MAGTGTVFLMYHELGLPGRQLCEGGTAYLRYVVTDSNFRRQISALRELGWAGRSVTQGLSGGLEQQHSVVITFDDGSETDLTVSAPALAVAGFQATFYVLSGSLGRQGYLSPAQLRELSDAGFEIGSHSVTHRLLTDLNRDVLRAELVDSKKKLEDLSGKRVDHFSCPKGRWNWRIVDMAREAGYCSVATSRIGVNHPGTNPFSLARVPVLRETSLDEFRRLVQGKGLLLRRARASALALAKRLLGNRVYERVRFSVFDRNRQQRETPDLGGSV
jgi:peptidoglycan/xylan/chitin deacetylase (PgdA/CDA1 family)